MESVKKILNKFNGLYFSQEYLCLAKEQFKQPLHAFLVNKNRIVRDITADHNFIGYCPLIFTLYSNPVDKIDLPDLIEIVFTDHILQTNEILKKKDALARLSLKMIRRQSVNGYEICQYEGVHAEHHFISRFHQLVNGLYNQRYNKKPGNVFLHDNLYKQVQIAYSLPRIISLVSVSDGQLFNLFPTDLHGPIGEEYYVSSLRHEGKACHQVETAGRIVISEIHADMYKTVYSLGKNHMLEMKPEDQFPFDDHKSSVLGLPLPKQTLRYRELELKETFNHGIHKILLYKVLSINTFTAASIPGYRISTPTFAKASTGKPDAEPQNSNLTLSHIHNVYATYRHNKHLSGNYLLR